MTSISCYSINIPRVSKNRSFMSFFFLPVFSEYILIYFPSCRRYAHTHTHITIYTLTQTHPSKSNIKGPKNPFEWRQVATAFAVWVWIPFSVLQLAYFHFCSAACCFFSLYFTLFWVPVVYRFLISSTEFCTDFFSTDFIQQNFSLLGFFSLLF